MAAAPSATRRVLRWVGRMAMVLVALALTLALGFTLFAVSALPPLQPWHTELLRNEFDADKHQDMDFAAYQRLEQQLFDELQAKTAQWARDGVDPSCPRPTAVPATVMADDCALLADETFRTSRFNHGGWVHRLAEGAPYNRSFRLTPDRAVGMHCWCMDSPIHPIRCAPWQVRCMVAASTSRCCACPGTARCRR